MSGTSNRIRTSDTPFNSHLSTLYVQWNAEIRNLDTTVFSNQTENVIRNPDSRFYEVSWTIIQ